MQRREFIAMLGGAATAWPRASRAQAKIPVIGFLGSNTPAAAGHLTSEFIGRLRDLGWVEGRNVGIEYRWAAGQTAKYREFASEFVAANVNVIVTTGNASAMALQQSTSSIPIVLATSADIVRAGIVKSLARPGGNVTGLTFAPDDFVGKRVELLKEIVPGLKRVGFILNPDAGKVELDAARQVSQALALDLDIFEFRTTADLDRIGSHAQRAALSGLYIRSDPLVFTNRKAINAFAIREKLPTVHRLREYVVDGGLISYGPDFRAFFRRAADYVDKILKGVKPEQLPIEGPTKFELFINLKTARTLGIDVPPVLLGRADEVIE